jgi:hypothetical protein
VEVTDSNKHFVPRQHSGAELNSQPWGRGFESLPCKQRERENGGNTNTAIWVTAILTFKTFAIEKSEILKFRICSKETKILQSSCKGNESESKSQQRTYQ